MEESLKEMVVALQGAGVEVNMAIADFGDIDAYDFDGGVLFKSPNPGLDSNRDKDWTRWQTGYEFIEFTNHLNYVMSSADNPINKQIVTQSGPYNIYEWKFNDDANNVMDGKQPSKVYTGEGKLNNAFTPVGDLNMDDIITGLRISNSKMLGTNYDLGLEAMYRIAYERQQQNLAAGVDRDIVCVFMSDGAAMQYNYFSGTTYSNGWVENLRGNTDSIVQSGYSWSLEKDEKDNNRLVNYNDFHPVVKDLLTEMSKLLHKDSEGYGHLFNEQTRWKKCTCGYNEENAEGKYFLDCINKVGATVDDWDDIFRLVYLNTADGLKTATNHEYTYLQDAMSGLDVLDQDYYQHKYDNKNVCQKEERV
jgi:hypothetical protein